MTETSTTRDPATRPSTNGRKVAIYAYSEGASGLRRQIANCRAYANERLDALSDLEVFCDTGGRERPELLDMLAKIEGFDLIIVQDNDRLSRNSDRLVRIATFVRNAGATLHVVSETVEAGSIEPGLPATGFLPAIRARHRSLFRNAAGNSASAASHSSKARRPRL